MSLSLQQRAALLRLSNLFWTSPRGNGRVQFGFTNTLYSLRKRGLVFYIHQFAEVDGVKGPGWVLTDSGKTLLPALRVEAKTNSKLRNLVTK